MSSPGPPPRVDRLEVLAIDGIGDVRAGDDLAALLTRAAGVPLAPGDVVVVSSKVVAKAAGLTVGADRETVVEQYTDRVVATRGSLRVVRLYTGTTLAAAGVDESNTAAGTVVPLPPDPDASARDLRNQVIARTGVNVAVVVTDTAGRAWRQGQTDLAIGVAGLPPLVDLAGTLDGGGRPLRVTAPAIADEVAAAADLVRQKALGRPFAVVRGLAALVLAPDDHGPGAVALVRAEADDLFGLGSQDAVRHAVRRDDASAVRGYPDAGPIAEWLPTLVADALTGSDPALVSALVAPLVEAARVLVLVPSGQPSPAMLLAAGALAERVRVLAAAHRGRADLWTQAGVGVPSRWQAVVCLRVVTEPAPDGTRRSVH